MHESFDVGPCDKLLTTTRSIRKRLDLTRPVPPELIEECLEIALQSPSATNTQKWRFVVVRDAQKRAALAAVYKQAFQEYWAQADQTAQAYGTGDAHSAEADRLIDSAVYLSEHLGEVPVHVLFCIEDRIDPASLFQQSTVFGSILPAAWSFMLAARARGLGCCWTTVHLLHADETAQLLDLPDTVTQAVLLPVAYYTGRDFKVAPRTPAAGLTHWDGWGRRR